MQKKLRKQSKLSQQSNLGSVYRTDLPFIGKIERRNSPFFEGIVTFWKLIYKYNIRGYALKIALISNLSLFVNTAGKFYDFLHVDYWNLLLSWKFLLSWKYFL